MHLIVMALAISLVMGSILFSSYAAPPASFIGHDASEISVSVDGSDMSLAEALLLLGPGATSGTISHDSCHDVVLDFSDDVSVLTQCSSNEFVAGIRTSVYNDVMGDSGEWYVSGIRCCNLIVS